MEARETRGAVGTGTLLYSQQDFEDAWEEEAWPTSGNGFIACKRTTCDSRGFERSRLESVVKEALAAGFIVAGAIQCEGTDRATMKSCTNALVYLWEEDA